ncbi:Neuropeptide capa receptor [Folsomia candida]|uniref:Neuropeptide capa receptor n=1 Tax=Folsomia candida TaxID=158441 RepID=A0A226F0V6_FOLCA|nr:Neuropeptide capa receptor [Folsomia candida]
MAIVVAIPFAVRVLFHNEVGPWSSLYQAFFHTYLELYLGNSCLATEYVQTSAKFGTSIYSSQISSNSRNMVATALRLGCDICVPRRCPCGEQVTTRGYHGLKCRKSAGRHSRHAAANDVIARALRSAEVPCIREPPGCARADGKKPDGLTMVPWSRGRSLVWDFTCADTFAPSYLSATSIRPGAAAETAQSAKHRKYAFLQDRFLFVPVAMETTGVWAKEGLYLIEAIGERIASTTGEGRAKSFLIQRVSVAIQRGNVSAILGTLPQGRNWRKCSIYKFSSGIGVMMLVALTMERFVAVCHPEKSRAMQGSKKAYIIIASIPILTLIAHSPHMMRFSLVQCQSEDGLEKYQGKENQQFLSSTLYLVYKWFISLIFRLIPTILLAYLNLRIIVAYRRTCARRRLMTGKTSRDESKKFAEESRIMLLLGSTSVLFFVCVTPMVILSLMFTKTLLKSFSFQHSDWLLRFPLGQS